MHILIADDDYISRKFIYTVMSKLGKVEVANDGVDAIDAYRTALAQGKPFQLICLDVMMPDKDGTEVLKDIRSIEADLQHCVQPAKIIMTTAVDDRDSVMRILGMGCDAYVLKPVNKQALLAKIGELGLFDETAPEE